MAASKTPTPADLAAFFTGPATFTPIVAGHINETFRVDAAAGRFVLQRLSAIFSPAVNEDIAALTPRLKRAGLPTPELVPTRAGRLWHVAHDGGIWRLLTFLEGHTHMTATGPAMADAAGEFLARFHRALLGADHTFVAARLGVHDTPAHLAGLQAALAAHRDHPMHAAVAALAGPVQDALARLGPLPACAPRIVHGDPKLSNFLFWSPAKVHAMVDLDTIGTMELALELGDALRSWSNSGPGGGEGAAPTFDLSLFSAAITGYARGAAGTALPEEIRAIARGTLLVALELTSRFLRDALEERYFGWDPTRFARPAEHHLQRAGAQFAFAESLERQLPAARAAVGAAFGRSV